jgi:hypothetical protein
MHTSVKRPRARAAAEVCRDNWWDNPSAEHLQFQSDLFRVILLGAIAAGVLLICSASVAQAAVGG